MFKSLPKGLCSEKSSNYSVNLLNLKEDNEERSPIARMVTNRKEEKEKIFFIKRFLVIKIQYLINLTLNVEGEAIFLG